MEDEIPDGDNAVLVGTSQAAAVRDELTESGQVDHSTAREGATQASDHHADDDKPDPDSDEPDDDGGSSDQWHDRATENDKPEISRARQQAARYRRQLRDVESERDELAAALWTERVAALGVLADPTDLPHDPDALHD